MATGEREEVMSTSGEFKFKFFEIFKGSNGLEEAFAMLINFEKIKLNIIKNLNNS